MVNLRIGVIVIQEDRKRLEKVCEARGELLSNFIRRAIRKEFAVFGLLTEEEVKFLNV